MFDYFSPYTNVYFFVPSSCQELRRKKEFSKSLPTCHNKFAATRVHLKMHIVSTTQNALFAWSIIYRFHWLVNDKLLWKSYHHYTLFFTFLANIMIKRTNIWYVIFSLLNTNCILYNGVDAHEVAVPFAITKMHRLTMVQLI